MPKDLYQWGSMGGLLHHCPFCFTPLTSPQAQARCLGIHVECCKRYHTQLFKIGSSDQCAPCRAQDEEHIKRHREIAEIVEEIKSFRVEKDEVPPSPMTPKTPNAVQYGASPGSLDNPMTKRERKAAKKARKSVARANSVTSTEIDAVAAALHPEVEETDQASKEQQLLGDKDFDFHMSYHKGTTNYRDLRNGFVKKDRRGSRPEKNGVRIDQAEIDAIMTRLGVSGDGSCVEEKSKISTLRKKIEEDLLQMENENDQLRMRKAGFWRWASKKAGKRMMDSDKFWRRAKKQSLVKEELENVDPAEVGEGV